MRTRNLSLRRERLHELTADELARVAGGRPNPIDTQLCNCTGTSHPNPTGDVFCLLSLSPYASCAIIA